MTDTPVLAFGLPSPPEMLFILIILLLLFGAKKLPELARGIGKSMKEFKRATSEIEGDFRSAMDASDPENPNYRPENQQRKPRPAPEGEKVS